MLVRWRVGKQINRSLVGGVFTKGYFSSLFTWVFYFLEKKMLVTRCLYNTGCMNFAPLDIWYDSNSGSARRPVYQLY